LSLCFETGIDLQQGNSLLHHPSWIHGPIHQIAFPQVVQYHTRETLTISREGKREQYYDDGRAWGLYHSQLFGYNEAVDGKVFPKLEVGSKSLDGQ
jgi:hypothetical protein